MSDLLGGLHEVAGGGSGLERERSLQVSGDVAVLGGSEDAVGVCDLEQYRGGGEPHRVVLSPAFLRCGEAALEAIEETGEVTAGVY